MEANLQLLGPIVRLQIQTDALKTGVKPFERYDPSALLAVAALTLSDAGAEAPGPDGARLLDVHHRDHPASRQLPGTNALSVGVTAHYAAIQHRFGADVQLGCAGENVIIDCGQPLAWDQAARGLWIVGPGGARPARLSVLSVAAPCRPFTRYLMQAEAGTEPADLKDNLQFLGAGRRGFYAALSGDGPVTVRLGDLVFSPP